MNLNYYFLYSRFRFSSKFHNLLMLALPLSLLFFVMLRISILWDFGFVFCDFTLGRLGKVYLVDELSFLQCKKNALV